MTQLGAALTPKEKTQTALVRALAEEVMEAVAADLRKEALGEFTQALLAIINRVTAPVLNVPPSRIDVAAPSVSVSPTIDVQIPDTSEAVLNALQQVVNQNGILIALTNELLNELRKPMTTDVTRDGRGLIEKTIQRRG